MNYAMPPTLLTTDEIAEGLRDREWDWEGSELVKTVELADFAAAMVWVNRVAALAEQHNHHPDISISYKRVTLRLSTHSAGGITELDLDLARAIDALQ
jgi:4a-hydroxytetrahydrobiopterin dehydratase